MNSPTYFYYGLHSLKDLFLGLSGISSWSISCPPSSVFNALDAKISCLNVIVTKPPSEEHVGDFTPCVWQASVMRFTLLLPVP